MRVFDPVAGGGGPSCAMDTERQPSRTGTDRMTDPTPRCLDGGDPGGGRWPLRMAGPRLRRADAELVYDIRVWDAETGARTRRRARDPATGAAAHWKVCVARAALRRVAVEDALLLRDAARRRLLADEVVFAVVEGHLPFSRSSNRSASSELSSAARLSWKARRSASKSAASFRTVASAAASGLPTASAARCAASRRFRCEARASARPASMTTPCPGARRRPLAFLEKRPPILLLRLVDGCSCGRSAGSAQSYARSLNCANARFGSLVTCWLTGVKPARRL